MSVRVAGLIVLGIVAGRSGAQTVAYRAPADTVYLLTSNPHRLYWVKGADTIGGMAPSLVVTAERWRSEGAGFVVTTRQMDLDTQRRTRTDTMRVDASGHVAVPAGPAAAHAVDFALHLPARATPLTVGLTWVDSTVGTATGSVGPAFAGRGFRVMRTLRVTRAFDSLGTRLVEIAGQGNVRYGDSWYADSTSRAYAWMDVAGRTHETYWFDVRTGRQIGRRWMMDLRGKGGRPTPAGTDTTPAGLVASETERVLPIETGRLLWRALPGRDTSYALELEDGNPVAILFVQTERLEHGTGGAVTIASGFGRNDGMIGTVTATFTGGRVRRYDATWTDTSVRVVRQSLVARGDTLVFPDSVSVAPDVRWAVADYGMDELLAPLLRSFHGDTLLHPIAVFRPKAGHWDRLFVRVRALGAGPGAPFLALVGEAGDRTPVVLIIGHDDVLLYAEDTRHVGSRRVPRADSHRTAELKALMDMAKQVAPKAARS